VAISVAVAVAVLVGALVLLGHRREHSTPTPPAGQSIGALIEHTPPAQLRRELNYIAVASREAERSDACPVPAARRISQTQIHRPPGSALLSTLRVLRRPRTANDAPPPGALTGGNVYAGATRRALVAGGTTYYIVPERDDPAAELPSSRCLTLHTAALHRALPHIPKALRAQTVALQAAIIAVERGLVARGPQDIICVVTHSRNAGGSTCGTTVAQIQHGIAPDDDQGTFSAVVPDGVATVTLRFPAARGHAARSVTADVHGNVYAVRIAGESPAGRQALSPVAIWRSAQGTVIRTVTQPSPAAAAKFCREHPVQCLQLSLSQSSGQSSASSSSSSASATATTPAKGR
jgi:hypothetical protein